MAYPTKNEITRLPSKTLNVTLWAMQVLAALAFLSAAGAKLAGSRMMVRNSKRSDWANGSVT